jgi:hypothetical protein
MGATSLALGGASAVFWLDYRSTRSGILAAEAQGQKPGDAQVGRRDAAFAAGTVCGALAATMLASVLLDLVLH